MDPTAETSKRYWITYKGVVKLCRGENIDCWDGSRRPLWEVFGLVLCFSDILLISLSVSGVYLMDSQFP